MSCGKADLLQLDILRYLEASVTSRSMMINLQNLTPDLMKEYFLGTLQVKKHTNAIKRGRGGLLKE